MINYNVVIFINQRSSVEASIESSHYSHKAQHIKLLLLVYKHILSYSLVDDPLVDWRVYYDKL